MVEVLNALLSSIKQDVSAVQDSREIPWWPVSMWSVEQIMTADRTRPVTSSVRNVSLFVVQAHVLRMLHVLVSITNQSAHVIQAPEEMVSYHAYDVRLSRVSNHFILY